MSYSTSRSETNASYPHQEAKANTLAALAQAYKHDEEKVHDIWGKKLFIPEAVFGDRCKNPDARLTSDSLTEEQWGGIFSNGQKKTITRGGFLLLVYARYRNIWLPVGNEMRLRTLKICTDM